MKTLIYYFSLQNCKFTGSHILNYHIMNQDNNGPTGPSGEVPKRRRIAEDEDSDDDDNNNNMDTEQINDNNQVGAPSSQSTTTNNPPNNDDNNQDEEEEDAELTKRQRIEARANERRRQRLLQAEARDLLEASYPGDDYYVGKFYLILCSLYYMLVFGLLGVLGIVEGI